jgi:hypothetical protein
MVGKPEVTIFLVPTSGLPVIQARCISQHSFCVPYAILA